MNPNSIKRIIKQSQDLRSPQLQQEPSPYESCVAAFIVAWMGWEAVRTRFLRVVINKKGWAVKDADLVLAKARISSMKGYANALVKLDEDNPFNWSGDTGKAWKNLKAIEPLRHRLSHGFKSVSPETAEIAADVVLFYLNDLSWLENIQLKDVHINQDKQVGSLFARRRRLSNHERLPISELALKMNVDLNKKSPKIPHRDKLLNMPQLKQESERSPLNTLNS